MAHRTSPAGRLVLAGAAVVVLLSVAAFFAYKWWTNEPTDPTFGRFEGEIVTKWVAPDREMQLMQDFAYIDPRGKRWLAPADSKIDGASIPAVFWSLIGGPFEGPYRAASVVHDAACVAKQERWEDVHRMFYEACRCSRLGEGKAQAMYWAVYKFGPHWPSGSAHEIVAFAAAAPPDEDMVREAEAYFAAHELSLDEIESVTPEDVKQFSQ